MVKSRSVHNWLSLFAEGRITRVELLGLLYNRLRNHPEDKVAVLATLHAHAHPDAQAVETDLMKWLRKQQQTWVESAKPEWILKAIRSTVSDRKLRLFAVSCCRRVLHQVGHEWHAAVEAAESFAEGTVTREQLARTRRRLAYNHRTIIESDNGEISAAKAAVLAALSRQPFQFALDAASLSALSMYRCTEEDADLAAEQQWQADCLRELVCNPFLPVVLDPRWQTSAVVALAQAIYDDQSFERLPVLADALEESGCNNGEMLAHLRGRGPHVRGCWPVDRILGKP